jgi:hypothetical protein
MLRNVLAVTCALALLLGSTSNVAAQDITLGVKGGINVADVSSDVEDIS